MDQEQIVAKYPRMVPRRGIDPNDGDPANHIRIEKPEEHIRQNPEDYQRMLSETPAVGVTIKHHIEQALRKERLEHAADIEVAVAEERERCAVIAESKGGRQGQAVANAIRELPQIESAPSQGAVGIGSGQSQPAGA